MNRCCLWLSP